MIFKFNHPTIKYTITKEALLGGRFHYELTKDEEIIMWGSLEDCVKCLSDIWLVY